MAGNPSIKQLPKFVHAFPPARGWALIGLKIKVIAHQIGLNLVRFKYEKMLPDLRSSLGLSAQ
jgi:hypothetical protein